MPRRRVVITLPTDAYRHLAEVAEAEERAVDQQASLLLKQLLLGSSREPGPSGMDEIVGPATSAHAADEGASKGLLHPSAYEQGEEGRPS
jgi:hypothetical protein